MFAARKYIYILLVCCLSSSGCSFHSNQFEALKTIFEEDRGPKPQWLFSWGEVTAEVFAINAGSSIFFASSDGLLVRFNGSFIESIAGLKLGPDKVFTISITKRKVDSYEVFSFSGFAANFGDLYCQDPIENSSELALKTGIMPIMEISQKCLVNNQLVDQSILLNESRQLVGLRFFLHPAHAPATIRYNPI